MISQTRQMVKLAFDKGYRVVNNTVYSPSGKILKYNLTKSKYKYRRFSLRVGKTSRAILIHHLVAYQKFKDKWLNSNLQIRHLDTNCENNNENNIELGTNTDNYYDVPDFIRKTSNQLNRISKQKLTDAQVIEIKDAIHKGESRMKFVEKYNMCFQSICNIINGVTYKHIL